MMASSLFLLLVCLQCVSFSSITVGKKMTYIVHMKQQEKPSIYPTHHHWYSAHLNSSSDSLLYAYTSAYNGFAASLHPSEADALAKSNAVLGVYQDTLYPLHTTHSPEFLGLTDTQYKLWEGHNLDQASHDVIIGVLDTGIWPESKSFDDIGMPDIPTWWRGECESGPDFAKSLCNKKLIGVRSFSKGFLMASPSANVTLSPRDQIGHGTHTASIATGSPVTNASLFGYANGTARGMAPQARIAAYKVCWTTGCYGSDILAGMDRAIHDGVNVISLSAGDGGGAATYYRDTIAIGAFTAVERNVFVSCSVGNAGPSKESLANVAPWIMTVGAGTLDRDFPAYVSLGNQKRFNGVSVSVSLHNEKGTVVGLVYNKGSSQLARACMPDSLDPIAVRGKVVLCDKGLNEPVEKGTVVHDAGGIGMILANSYEDGEELVAVSHLLPTVTVGRMAGDEIRDYAVLDPNPTTILRSGGTVLNLKPAPVVAAFSSRGPNLVTPQILKPDVIGPGVNILAAWLEDIGPSGLSQDTRKTEFNIMTGTSMSCPHISGIAALVKAAHPRWSPSAIKSALMTTAYTHDNTNSPLRDNNDGSLSNPWYHGAGHVDPLRALSPGLVYDASPSDYIAFLCSLDYNLDQIQTIVKRPNVSCSTKYSDPGQLNYPSFSVVFGRKRVVRYTRTLTNVGAPGSTYEVTVTGPSSLVDITVKPTKLVFAMVGERQRYTVTFVSKKDAEKRAMWSEFGNLVWSNHQHQVASPIAFTWPILLGS